MPLQSDLKLDYSKFDPASITAKTKALDDGLMKIFREGVKWWEVGAPKYREMRWNGETSLPRPVVLDAGKDIKLPSREKGREIPCRVFEPESGKAKGIFYHIHGGGWVLQSEHYQDALLKHLADSNNLTVLSVGYRLAPEHPYPQGNEDCFDIGEYLIDNGEKHFGVPLLFMTGDSAGAHLSVVTAFHLLQTRPAFAFKGLVLNFGAYDLSGFLPEVHTFDLPLVLDREIMTKYIEAYLPNTTEKDRRDPRISPLFANMTKMKLPPALFAVGTLDCLMDDSVMMCAKWAMSGAKAVLKVYPGAPHGFNFFPKGSTEETDRCLDDVEMFVSENA